MANENERIAHRKYYFDPLSLIRMLLTICVPFAAYSLGLLPCIFSSVFIIQCLDLSKALHLIFLAMFCILELLIILVTETIAAGVFIWIFGLTNKDGTYEVSVRNWAFFRFAVFNLLYRPPMKLIEEFRLLALRKLVYRLQGMKMGKDVTISGTEQIFDPYATEIGEGTFLGGHTKIYGHVIEGKLMVKKVKIGRHCLIGAETTIMPGAVIEDGVILGIKSLVLKNQRLRKGGTYVGIPAKEIKQPGSLLPPT